MAHSRGLSIRLKIPTRVQPEVMPPPGKVGQFTNKIHHMKKYLLSELSQHDFAAPFMEPVDSEALNVPTYYTIIEQPMDMGTITMRVKNRYYRSVDELISDVRLVISNCYTFNRPDAMVYSDGQKLERLFLKVLAKLPSGEEVVYSAEKGERSLVKRQCRYRLRKLQDQTEELEQDAQTFFHESWLPLAEKLHKREIKTLDEFDKHLDGILKHCQDHGKRILDSYEYEVSRPPDEEENGGVLPDNGDETGSHMWECHRPELDWEDGLIDALDDTVTCLKQDLVVMGRQGGSKQVKPSYSGALLPMFVNAQIICEGLCSQTNLPDSSDDEMKCETKLVSEEERNAIRKQFHELSPEAMFDVMHIIEQAEYRSASNTDRKYQVMQFRPETINLIKTAIPMLSKSNQQDTQYDETEPMDCDHSGTAVGLDEPMTQDDDVGGDYADDHSLQEHQAAIPSVPCSLEGLSEIAWEGRSDGDSNENDFYSDSEIDAETSMEVSAD